MNKNAIVNCRWTVRPVRSDGQSLPGKDGKEVSNMDYVYFEQVGWRASFVCVVGAFS